MANVDFGKIPPPPPHTHTHTLRKKPVMATPQSLALPASTGPRKMLAAAPPNDAHLSSDAPQYQSKYPRPSSTSSLTVAATSVSATTQ